MSVSLPDDASIALVATETDLVLLLDRDVRGGAEREDGCLLLSFGNFLGMRSARPVARLALQLRERRSRIGALRVPGPEDRKHGELRGFVMAAQAGVGATLRVARVFRCCCRLRCVRAADDRAAQQGDARQHNP